MASRAPTARPDHRRQQIRQAPGSAAAFGKGWDIRARLRIIHHMAYLAPDQCPASAAMHLIVASSAVPLTCFGIAGSCIGGAQGRYERPSTGMVGVPAVGRCDLCRGEAKMWAEVHQRQDEDAQANIEVSVSCVWHSPTD